MTSPVIVLGCAFWDTILKVGKLPQAGGKILPEIAVQAASGMATAAAASIARLGGTVDLWTRIGDDPNGDAYLHDLAADGVPTAHIRRIADGRTWFSTILVDAAGERLIVPFADPSLDRDPSWLPLERIAGAGAVLADMRWIEGAEALFAEARRQGVPCVLDADTAPVDLLRRLVPLADHVLFSEPALAAFANDRDPEPALRRVAAGLDAAVVAVTLGERGALFIENGDLRHVPTLAVAAVDTLNAGDVWHGAYAFGLASGWDTRSRIRLANVAAAIKCERFGGRKGAPGLAEVLARAEGLACVVEAAG